MIMGSSDEEIELNEVSKTVDEQTLRRFGHRLNERIRYVEDRVLNDQDRRIEEILKRVLLLEAERSRFVRHDEMKDAITNTRAEKTNEERLLLKATRANLFWVLGGLALAIALPLMRHLVELVLNR